MNPGSVYFLRLILKHLKIVSILYAYGHNLTYLCDKSALSNRLHMKFITLFSKIRCCKTDY